MTTPRIPSPIPGVVTSVVDESLLAVAVRGRIFEVSIVNELLFAEVGDTVLIELLPSSKQWVLLTVIPP